VWKKMKTWLFRPLEGKSVLLKIGESEDLTLFRTLLRGNISQILPSFIMIDWGSPIIVRNSAVLIKLDPPLDYKEEKLQWMLAIPRHYGLGLIALFYRYITVNIYRINSAAPPDGVKVKDMIFICEMKLQK
jgi:hypothetical protein